ncbi:MAG: DUF503 domain-containing protein [Actinomycetia bacterium]|nr:DUF503 domain-containing protein [Actinomycetes bacterium]
MITAVTIITLSIPGNNSLKGKRALIKSLMARVRKKFNVSSAEVDLNDMHRSAVLAFSTVSTEKAIIENTFEKLCEWIEINFPDVMVTKREIELY